MKKKINLNKWDIVWNKTTTFNGWTNHSMNDLGYQIYENSSKCILKVQHYGSCCFWQITCWKWMGNASLACTILYGVFPDTCLRQPFLELVIFHHAYTKYVQCSRVLQQLWRWKVLHNATTEFQTETTRKHFPENVLRFGLPSVHVNFRMTFSETFVFSFVPWALVEIWCQK